MKRTSRFLVGIILLATAMLAGHAAAQDCVEPPPGLVSWWPGDGNFDDIQTANDTIIGDAPSDANSISAELLDLATQETAITDSVTVIRAQAALALTVPAAIEAEVDVLEAYLDEQLSGECKANIVTVRLYGKQPTARAQSSRQRAQDVFGLELGVHSSAPRL